MAQLQSAAIPFRLSKELLGCAVVSCDSDSLARTVSLLSCSDMVLAVHDRLEGTNSSFSSKVRVAKIGKIDENDDPNININALPNEGVVAVPVQRKGTVSTAEVVVDLQNNSALNLFKISQTDFVKDGLLMPATVVLGPLLRHAAKEFARRCRPSLQSSTDNNSEQTTSAEIDDLVQLLQRSETIYWRVGCS